MKIPKTFMLSIKNRERRNSIRGLVINGEGAEEPEHVKTHMFEFFARQFSSSYSVGQLSVVLKQRKLDRKTQSELKDRLRRMKYGRR